LADAARPPVAVTLEWKGGMRFAGPAPGGELLLDGDGAAGPSPVQALAFALAGCMAADLVLILTRSRVPPRALRATFTGERAPEDPRRFVRVALGFELHGDVPAEKVERAIALSREKYCSVWHSLRPDIELTTSFEIVDGRG
jgi:putative redox protein